MQISEVPAYVICLERKKEERCDVNFDSIKQIFPKAIRTEAVDAKELDSDDDNISIYARYHIQTKVDTDYMHMGSLGGVGCAMSHANIWKKVVKTNTPSIVVEDDMFVTEENAKIIQQAYAEIPKDSHYASIIHLPWPGSKLYNPNHTYQPIDSREAIAGCQMYYITPKCAKLFLKHVYPIVSHADVFVAYMAVVFPEIKAVYYANAKLYPLFNFLRDDFASTIKHDKYIKKILPESNSFYICILIINIIMVTSIIILLCTRNKK